MTKLSKEYLTGQILYVVQNQGAVKNVDLALKVAQLVHPSEFNTNEYLELVEELVRNHKIREVEYVLPSMPDRLKSVYFPAGTVLKVVNQ